MQDKADKNKTEKDNGKKSFVLTNKWKALIIATIGVLIFVVVIFSPAFAINEINIQGSEYYSEEELKTYLEYLQGKNGNVLLLNNTTFSQGGGIFNRHLIKKEQELMFEFPLLKDAEITYSAPHTLNVKLSDRQPVMMVDFCSTYIYVDTQGYVLSVNSEGDSYNLPVVQGLDIDTYKVGTPLTMVADHKIDAAIKLCMAISELSLNDNIDIIDISDYNKVRMFCAPSLAIEFGNLDNLKLRLSILKSVFETGKDGYSDGTIDMTGGNTPVFRENTKEENTEGYE